MLALALLHTIAWELSCSLHCPLEASSAVALGSKKWTMELLVPKQAQEATEGSRDEEQNKGQVCSFPS